MTETQVRSKVVDTMKSWIGCKESDGSHKKIIDIYNGHKPLARGYAVKYTDPWCAAGASAAAIAAGLTDIIPTECSCSRMLQLFKDMGCWQEDDGYVPKAGDYIFYDWNDNGVGDNVGDPDHVGIVEKVAGSTITAIECNINDAVGRRNIQVNGRYIRGYGIPKYASKASAASSGTTSGAVSNSGTIAVGKTVRVKSTAAKYATGQTIPSWVKGKTYTVQQIKDSRVLLKEIESWVNISDLELAVSGTIAVGKTVRVKSTAAKYATGQTIPNWVKGKTYTVQQVKDSRALLKEIESWVNVSDLELT